MTDTFMLLKDEILKENDKVSPISEDKQYYYFYLHNKDQYDFKGVARINKESNSNNEYYVQYKASNDNDYRGDGIIKGSTGKIK